MNNKITVNHTHIKISNYNLGDCEGLEKMLSIWNPSYFRYDKVGFEYNEERRELLIPRGVNINYIENKLDTVSTMDYNPDQYDNISIKLKTLPRDDMQKNAIAFLLGETNYGYTKKYSQLLLNLSPGKGKTYITTASLSFIGMKAIVITHTEKIKQQWVDSFMNNTDLSQNQICNISGSSSIKSIMSNNRLKYKVYLINHATITAYAKKHGWESITELFKHLKIGVKIYDEAHLCFSNIIKIDLYTNTKKNIYLTATFDRSDRNESRLFNTCFSNIVKFTDLSYKKDNNRKHIVYIGVLYNSKPTLDTQTYMVTNRGFNKMRYSQYQSGCKTFYEVLDYVVNYFNDKEGKLMILSSTIECVESITEFLKSKINDKTISSYHSKVADKEKALMSDIISTTSKSAGVGFDLPGLRTVIMTESYASKIDAEQVSGRLREYSATDNTFYVELIDTGFKRVYSMYKDRMKVFKKKCLKILYINLEDKFKGV